MNKEDEQFRDDAAIVYRSLRDDGAAPAAILADRCFPTTTDGPATTIAALKKRSWRKVIDSLVWMRHHGVTIWAAPDDGGTIFSLTKMEIAVPVTPRDPEATPMDEDLWHVVTG